jgi:heme/copper-type cytochrome/quinol oxidase subunit 1
MRDHGKLSSSLAEFFGQENVYIAVLPRCGMMSHIIYMVIHAHIFIYYMHINIYIYQ